ncbi:52K [White sturgeon adenovirus 1]|uniref:52K n=1 Tax=White sturgeon adenovirus 1 TaxID=2580388 RepID=A0A4P8PIN3_9ADEN|nr:52K [White sturgeon adenovirus 1]QCQ84152.1 52K [White sturgeon adenovirus 1]
MLNMYKDLNKRPASQLTRDNIEHALSAEQCGSGTDIGLAATSGPIKRRAIIDNERLRLYETGGDTVRDGQFNEHQRDMIQQSGRQLTVSPVDLDKEEDYEELAPGMSQSVCRLKAEKMKNLTKHTDEREYNKSRQDYNQIHMLVSHSQVKMGLMYISDLLSAICNSSTPQNNYQLAAQMSVIAMHCQGEVISDLFMSGTLGEACNAWFVNIVHSLNTIVNLSKLSAKKATHAILEMLVRMSFQYASAASKRKNQVIPAMSVVQKTERYFKKIIVSVLQCSIKVGSYEPITVKPTPVHYRETDGMNDAEFMTSLRETLESGDLGYGESSEEEEEEEESGESGSDVSEDEAKHYV